MKNFALFSIGTCLVCMTSIARGLSGQGADTPNCMAETNGFYSLSKVVSGYASGNMANPDAAKMAASELLLMSDSFKNNWNYGNAIHHAHLVLGRIHLLNNAVVEAITELKLAGQTKGSPQLNSFGPNMTLAKELLERGEKAAVLEYFDDCLKFWAPEFAKPKIESWKADIQSGKLPSFGANLVY